MGILAFVAVVAGVGVAACGGRVADDDASTAGAPTSTNPSNPGSREPSPGTSTPTVPPAGPLPSGRPASCGLYDGDGESTLAAYGKARAIATYVVASVVEECSGAGGLHVTLKRTAGCASSIIVHFGEHACYTKTNWAVGDRVIVGVEPKPGSVNNPGWCLDDVASWDGVARAMRALMPSESEEAALSRYGCTL